MTLLMPEQTVDPFGIVGTFPAKFKRAASSTVNIDLIAGEIHDVLVAWEEMTASPVHSPATLHSGSGTPKTEVRLRYPSTPVEAVEYVRGLLGVSQDAVLAAVGVAQRTFFGWKKTPSSRPRAASLGRLWLMVEALTHLQGSHPNLAAWIHSNPDAYRAFEAGQVNRLVQLEMEWVVRHEPAHTPHAPRFGDLGDGLAVSEDVVTQEAEETNIPAPSVPTLRSTPRGRTRLPR